MPKPFEKLNFPVSNFKAPLSTVISMSLVLDATVVSSFPFTASSATRPKALAYVG